MPARKTVEADSSVEAKKPEKDMVSPGAEIRTLEFVVPEARRLQQEEGLTVPEISAKLQISYDVLNQVFLRSYKSTTDTIELFERQEKARLSAE